MFGVSSGKELPAAGAGNGASGGDPDAPDIVEGVANLGWESADRHGSLEAGTPIVHRFLNCLSICGVLYAQTGGV
jgi:hypothetical protein